MTRNEWVAADDVYAETDEVHNVIILSTTTMDELRNRESVKNLWCLCMPIASIQGDNDLRQNGSCLKYHLSSLWLDRIISSTFKCTGPFAGSNTLIILGHITEWKRFLFECYFYDLEELSIPLVVLDTHRSLTIDELKAVDYPLHHLTIPDPAWRVISDDSRNVWDCFLDYPHLIEFILRRFWEQIWDSLLAADGTTNAHDCLYKDQELPPLLANISTRPCGELSVGII
jgi:hypothetical protein